MAVAAIIESGSFILYVLRISIVFDFTAVSNSKTTQSATKLFRMSKSLLVAAFQHWSSISVITEIVGLSVLIMLLNDACTSSGKFFWR